MIGAAPLGSGQHPIEVSETADKANAISSGGRGDLDGAQVLQSWRGLVGSMGRVGAAGDNAAMESFFALLQKNVLDRQRWSTREELRLAIVVWIERTYHRKRRQRRLGKLTPIEFETINTALKAA